MDSDDEIGKDPKHPDSVIRLASSVHRFYVPGRAFLNECRLESMSLIACITYRNGVGQGWSWH